MISSRKVPSRLHENCHMKIVWETDFVEPIIGCTQESDESQECSVVGISPPTLNATGEDPSNGNNNDPLKRFDRDLITKGNRERQEGVSNPK